MARKPRSQSLKWKLEYLLDFFDRLVIKFDNIDAWATRTPINPPPRPGRGLDDEYKRFKEEFAAEMRAKGHANTDAAAVDRLVRLAVATMFVNPVMRGITDKRSFLYLAMKCKVAAVETGWMSNEDIDGDLPDEDNLPPLNIDIDEIFATLKNESRDLGGANQDGADKVA
jgi:hypothetical protein